MTSVEFERMLSHRPNLNNGFPLQFCTRDLIYTYYIQYYDAVIANELTKAYTDDLYKTFIEKA